MGCSMSGMMLPLHQMDALPEMFEGFDPNAHPTNESIQLVKQSWAQMISQTDEMKKKQISPATLFYNHFYSYLSENHPVTEKIFAGAGFKARADSLLRMISSAVALATMSPSQSGERFKHISAMHKSKGIHAGHFKPVVESLAYSLQNMLGEQFTPEIQQAWLTVFSHAVMKMAPGMAHVPADPPTSPKSAKTASVHPLTSRGAVSPSGPLSSRGAVSPLISAGAISPHGLSFFSSQEHTTQLNTSETPPDPVDGTNSVYPFRSSYSDSDEIRQF